MKEIRGRPYLYFWHYEDTPVGRVQIYTYLGSARGAAAHEKLLQAVQEYYDRAEEELRRRRGEALVRALALRS